MSGYCDYTKALNETVEPAIRDAYTPPYPTKWAAQVAGWAAPVGVKGVASDRAGVDGRPLAPVRGGVGPLSPRRVSHGAGRASLSSSGLFEFVGDHVAGVFSPMPGTGGGSGDRGGLVSGGTVAPRRGGTEMTTVGRTRGVGVMPVVLDRRTGGVATQGTMRDGSGLATCGSDRGVVDVASEAVESVRCLHEEFLPGDEGCPMRVSPGNVSVVVDVDAVCSAESEGDVGTRVSRQLS